MSACTYPSNTLNKLERQYVLLTQNGLPVTAKPYHWVAQQLNISAEQAMLMTKDLQARGIIRRIAAVPNHYKLGYTYNGMTVWDIDDEYASEFGEAVGKLAFVSHCYLRPRHLPSWHYNLFAMVHGKSPEEINEYREQIKNLLKDVLVNRNNSDVNQESNSASHDMLTSTQILKKTGLRLKRIVAEKV